jgi:hypothetical protein
MRILAIVQGEYGNRMVENFRKHGPAHWTVESWTAPAVLPPIVDYPEDYLPETLPQADLLISLHEHQSVAQLLPDVAQMCGAQAAIVPIDRTEWLPKGLENQLRRWLANIGVQTVFPKPFCSLTETTYNVRRYRVTYDIPLIAEFARHFGRPRLIVTCDEATRVITGVEVIRDAACGCARYVAANIIGMSADEVEFEAGMLHHHYPCLAGMTKDPDFGDTLMHVSGNILKDEIGAQVKHLKEVVYVVPGRRSE